MQIKDIITNKYVIIGVIISVLLVLIFRYFKQSFIVQKYVFMDKKFTNFVYTEFDSPATGQDIGKDLPTYTKRGKRYLIGSGETNMSDEFIHKLDKARDIAGLSFTINSGFRTRRYNDNLFNAVADSAHIYGLAADIDTSSYDDDEKLRILDALRQVGFKRIGRAESFYHVDIDDTKPQTEWTYE